MMKRKKPAKRPAVLVRFYPTDLAALNKACADACTPRENFIRRVVLAALARTITADAAGRSRLASHSPRQRAANVTAAADE